MYVTPKIISVFGCLVILVLNETVESELEFTKYSVKNVNVTMSELKVNVHKYYLSISIKYMSHHFIFFYLSTIK